MEEMVEMDPEERKGTLVCRETREREELMVIQGQQVLEGQRV